MTNYAAVCSALGRFCSPVGLVDKQSPIKRAPLG
jgi:hypothetical protein